MIGISKEELLEIVDEIRAGIENDDSWEGFLNYLVPIRPPMGDDECPPGGRMVEARYHVGNSLGQGSMRMLGVHIGEREYPNQSPAAALAHILLAAYKFNDKPHQLFSAIRQAAPHARPDLQAEIIRLMDMEYNRRHGTQ